MALAVSSYEEKSRAFDCVTSLLRANSVEYIALKGIVIRELYPVKEFRTSGDIDFTVKKEELERVYELVKAEGLKIYSYNAGALTFEARDCVIEIHDSADVKNEYYDGIFAYANDGALDEYTHLLYVLCHLVKHLAYRGAGIRMLMDVDVMIRSIESFDVSKLFDMCEKAGVSKSAKTLIALSKLWFDTPVEIEDCIDDTLEKKLETVLWYVPSFKTALGFF